MKTINEYINEKFQVGNDYKRQYAYTPKNKEELIECIKEKIEKEGLGTKDKPLDLNDIDTSNIIDMSYLFSNYYHDELCKGGHYDISDWNVSNVRDMHGMFGCSDFDGDLSQWNVGNVENMKHMFEYSEFTGKNSDISNWDVSGVENMYGMFYESKFNGNIEKWDIGHVRSMEFMFTNCPLEKNPPKWYHE